MLQLRRDEHQVMKATIEQIRNITPAAIATIPIPLPDPALFPASCHQPHVFQHFLGFTPFAKYANCRSSNTRIRPFPLTAVNFPVLNLRSAVVLPLAKFALKAHALGDPEACDDAPLDSLAGLPGSLARSSVFPSRLIEVETNGRARRADSSRVSSFSRVSLACCI